MNCAHCKIMKPLNMFPERSDRPGKRRTTCVSCRSSLARGRYLRHKSTAYFKLKATRARSRSQSLHLPECDLTAEYLESIWTGYCPVLSIPLKTDTYRSDPQLAELDRFVPELGYRRGNVTFMSHRANMLKTDSSLTELRKVVKWMEQVENSNTQVG